MTGAMSVSAAVSLSMESVSSGRLLFADHVEREAFGDFFQHALRLLGLLEQLGDLRKRGDLDPQLLVQQQRQLVDQVQVPRIGKRDIQRSVLRLHAARSCSGTSDPRGWSGTDRGRSDASRRSTYSQR